MRANPELPELRKPRSSGYVKELIRSEIAMIGVASADEDHAIIDQEADS
jgi:hypothetical protein